MVSVYLLKLFYHILRPIRTCIIYDNHFKIHVSAKRQMVSCWVWWTASAEGWWLLLPDEVNGNRFTGLSNNKKYYRPKERGVKFKILTRGWSSLFPFWPTVEKLRRYRVTERKIITSRSKFWRVDSTEARCLDVHCRWELRCCIDVSEDCCPSPFVPAEKHHKFELKYTWIAGSVGWKRFAIH